MDLKVLMVLLIYYSCMSMFFIFGASTFIDYDVNVSLNDTQLAEGDETDRGGLFSTGVSFGRYFLFITLGLGLPEDTPGWFQIIFAIWQTVVLIFTVAWVISSIWNG